ncbi:MAG TPA: response regulator transcription factor [Epulopiscium sp.]|nr:response regulator transcription factor [Candidatus Epulonipiscium sp.]
MFKIAICDNDKSICSQIEHIILKYSAKSYLKIDIEVFYSGETLLNYIEQINQFDLIYLDIEMGNINGIEVGRRIRKVIKDYITEIVYISGKDDYDRQLFDVQPLHFIPKPISPNIIIEDLNLAIARSKKAVGFFKYNKGKDRFKVPAQDIIYFESVNREIKMVLMDKEDCFYSSMEEILAVVFNYQFVRIHRSYLINYNHVSVFRYDEIVMSNGDVLPISQSRRKEIREIQVNEE